MFREVSPIAICRFGFGPARTICPVSQGGQEADRGDRTLQDLIPHPLALPRCGDRGTAELSDAKAKYGREVKTALKLRVIANARAGEIVGRTPVRPHPAKQHAELPLGAFDVEELQRSR